MKRFVTNFIYVAAYVMRRTISLQNYSQLSEVLEYYYDNANNILYEDLITCNYPV